MTDIKEDGAAFASTTPANAAGSGGIAGIGAGAADQKEPGVNNKKKKLQSFRNFGFKSKLMSAPLKRLMPDGLDR